MKKKTILIVEDNNIYCKVIEGILGEEYHLHSTDSGEQALKLLSTYPIDLVFLDLILVDIDGFEVIKRIREVDNYKELPIIVSTVHYEEENIIKAIQMGANDEIPKPIIPELLLSKIERIFNSKIVKKSNTVKTILICDDVKSEIDILIDVIDGQYNVMVTLSAEQTIQVLNGKLKKEPDLFVIDAVLEGSMDGYELTGYIKNHERWKQTPVILNSIERTSYTDEIESHRHGADAFIIKSVDSHDLILAKIESFLAVDKPTEMREVI